MKTQSSLALHLAWTYREAGKIAEARKAFEQAESLGLRPEARDPLHRDLIDRLRRQLVDGQPSTSDRG